MSMLGSVGRAIMRRHNDAKARRLMNSLPPELQKDIGWEPVPGVRENARLARAVLSGTR